MHFKQFEADLIAARKDNKNEAFVKHHNSKYSGVLPVWAMVETLSFGAVSRLFSSLNISLQKQICEEYYNGLRHSTIANWFEGLVVLCNLCAHHARLVNRSIVFSPAFSSADNAYFESQGYERNQIGNRLSFRLIIIARPSPLRFTPALIEERILLWNRGTLAVKFCYVPLFMISYYGISFILIGAFHDEVWKP